MPASPGPHPHFKDDKEVICTSFYSKLDPLEGGEIHVSLVNGRPGAEGPSKDIQVSKLHSFHLECVIGQSM